jgi:hypothetical protein
LEKEDHELLDLETDFGGNLDKLKAEVKPLIPSTHKTFPIVFYNGEFIGGHDELKSHLKLKSNLISASFANKHIDEVVPQVHLTIYRKREQPLPSASLDEAYRSYLTQKYSSADISFANSVEDITGSSKSVVVYFLDGRVVIIDNKHMLIEAVKLHLGTSSKDVVSEFVTTLAGAYNFEILTPPVSIGDDVPHFGYVYADLRLENPLKEDRDSLVTEVKLKMDSSGGGVERYVDSYIRWITGQPESNSKSS